MNLMKCYWDVKKKNQDNWIWWTRKKSETALFVILNLFQYFISICSECHWLQTEENLNRGWQGGKRPDGLYQQWCPYCTGSLSEGEAFIQIQENLSGRERAMHVTAHLRSRHSKAHVILCPQGRSQSLLSSSPTYNGDKDVKYGCWSVRYPGHSGTW